MFLNIKKVINGIDQTLATVEVNVSQEKGIFIRVEPKIVFRSMFEFMKNYIEKKDGDIVDDVMYNIEEIENLCNWKNSLDFSYRECTSDEEILKYISDLKQYIFNILKKFEAFKCRIEEVGEIWENHIGLGNSL